MTNPTWKNKLLAGKNGTMMNANDIRIFLQDK